MGIYNTSQINGLSNLVFTVDTARGFEENLLLKSLANCVKKTVSYDHNHDVKNSELLVSSFQNFLSNYKSLIFFCFVFKDNKC